MEKVFKCLTCGADIRLERKPSNDVWLRWNLDGSPHIDEKKKSAAGAAQQQQQVVAELTKKVETPESKVDTLIAQIQMLRSDVVAAKAKK